MAPAVSVILPVYNRSASLGAAIQSVLTQSYDDLELIVVDDASSEDLKPIVEGFSDSRMRYIRREMNGGASAARNTGLVAAEGRFIAFQDSDDLWLPDKLKIQMALLEAMPEVGVVVHSKVLYGRGPDGTYGVGLVTIEPPPHRIMKPEDDQVLKYLTENRISLQNTLFRLDCYPDRKWFDDLTRANADWAFSSSLAQYARIAEYPDPVVLAFSSADSVSKVARAKAIGLIRIVKRNRTAYARYPQAYGAMMWQIGRILARDGKPRMARKFYREGFRRHPGFLLGVIGRKLRRLV